MDLGTLNIPILLGVKKFIDDVEKAKNASNDLGDKFKNLSNVAAGVAAAGIGSLVAGVGLAIDKTVDWRNRTDDLNKALGTSNEQSAGLSLLADRVGMSSEDISGAMLKLTKGLGDSQAALGPTGLALQDLGISAFDASGKILPATDILQAISDKLGNMPDSLSKSSIEMALFGKTGAEMNEILGTAANGGIKDFIDQAGKMGLVMSLEKSAEIEQFQRSNNKLKETMDGLAVSVGSKVIPKLIPFIDKLSELAVTVLPPLVGFLTDNLVPILIVLGTVIGVNVVSNLIGMATAATATIGPMLAAGGAALTAMAPVALPILAIIAAIAAVIAIIVILRDNWDSIMTFIGNVASSIANGVTQAWQTVVNIFTRVGDAIKGVWDWIGKLGNDLLNLVLPDWLTPGSPTPLENALVGIKQGMKDVSKMTMGDFSSSLKLSGVTPLAESRTSDNADIVSALQNLNTKQMDEAKLALLMRSAILQVTG